MVQNLTGRLEKVEETGDLTDEVGKLGEAMTGAVESLTGAVETLGDKLTDGLDNLASTTNGLDNIHLLTTARSQILRVDLQDFSHNMAYAEYSNFVIGGPDSFYRLHVDGDSLDYSNNLPFTTYNSDHDSHSGNCAVGRHGAWWYKTCAYSSLNGPYLTSAQETETSIHWHHWKNARIALKHVEMKIRPAM
nr:hypothetical protein BaRGS_016595 [Batillaria attramentaria]